MKMLSDPVAEAFGLIHRHPSGEDFRHGSKDQQLSVLVGPTDGINLILNTDKYKKMSVPLSLYHAVLTFHTALLPTSVRYLGQLGKTGILILLPQRFFNASLRPSPLCLETFQSEIYN